MSDAPSTTTLQVPQKQIPENLIRGVYANNIQQVSSGNETILDFSVVLPANYGVSEQGKLKDVQVMHEVVARIVIPPQVFLEFIRAYAANNPHVFSVEGALNANED